MSFAAAVIHTLRVKIVIEIGLSSPGCLTYTSVASYADSFMNFPSSQTSAHRFHI